MLAGELSASALEPLREVVHKVAGSAGMYGFPQLQEASSKLDFALLNVANVEPPIVKSLTDLIQNVMEAFDASH